MNALQSIRMALPLFGAVVASLCVEGVQAEGHPTAIDGGAADAVVSYAELNGPRGREVFKTLRQAPVTLRFEQGDRIPLRLDAESDVVRLEGEGGLYMVARTPFYVKIRQEGDTLFSVEGKRFTPFNADEHLALGLSMTDAGHPLIRAIVAINSNR